LRTYVLLVAAHRESGKRKKKRRSVSSPTEWGDHWAVDAAGVRLTQDRVGCRFKNTTSVGYGLFFASVKKCGKCLVVTEKEPSE
jgi:hypothetical protein